LDNLNVLFESPGQRTLVEKKPLEEIVEAIRNVRLQQYILSPKTVAKHRSVIKKKLSLNNVAEIAQYAISLGLIDVNNH
jgi:FixJ family two-component response regulator